MKLLAEISEGSLGIGEPEQLGGSYELRKSGRAILLDQNGNIAIQHLTTYNYHKLPGGGLDMGESVQQGLQRETLEEVGADCDLGDFIGLTIEYRNFENQIHISYCYTAYVAGEVKEAQLEEAEKKEGQETVWVKPSEALKQMRGDEPQEFQGHFILKRETSFLEEYLSRTK